MRTIFFIVAVAAPLPLMLVGCTSPEKQEAAAYANMLQPILLENSLVAERILYLSADVYNNSAKPDKLAGAWQQDVVPLAEHLHFQASFIEPPAAWRPPNDQLVRIWADRALAFRGLSEALIVSDPKAWRTSRDLASKAMIDEDTWFKDTNAKLAPFGFGLDQFP